MPHRERDGADRGLPGLRTWGEVWMGRPEGASSTNHPQGYPMSGKRIVWIPCPCVISLATILVP